MNLQYIYGTRAFIQLEKIISKWIQRPPKHFGGGLILGLLSGCSYLFRIYMIIRAFGYKYRIFSVYKSEIPVVSIGNIAAGGTGKTLFTCFLAEQLLDMKCAISSSGYRSIIGRQSAAIRVMRGMCAKYCGDEPLLIANKFPNAAVFSGKNRSRAALLAKEWGAECLILDDGMQHHKMHRDINIVMMRSGDLFGKNAFLPRGYLREHPSNLKRADLIVIHQTDSSIFEEQACQLEDYTSASIIGTKVCVSKVIDYTTREKIINQGEKIGLFCGIGDPSSFIDTIQALNYEIIEKLCIADHEECPIAKLEQFAIFCKTKGAVRLLCTEKDVMRLSDLILTPLSLPIGIVHVTLQIVTGQSEFTQLLYRIRSLL